MGVNLPARLVVIKVRSLVGHTHGFGFASVSSWLVCPTTPCLSSTPPGQPCSLHRARGVTLAARPRTRAAAKSTSAPPACRCGAACVEKRHTAPLCWGAWVCCGMLLRRNDAAFHFQTCPTIVQMVGRAGRPQFDTEGVAVIMTQKAVRAAPLMPACCLQHCTIVTASDARTLLWLCMRGCAPHRSMLTCPLLPTCHLCRHPAARAALRAADQRQRAGGVDDQGGAARVAECRGMGRVVLHGGTVFLTSRVRLNACWGQL